MVSYLGFMMTIVALATDETSALQSENRLGRQVHLHPELEQNPQPTHQLHSGVEAKVGHDHDVRLDVAYCCGEEAVTDRNGSAPAV